MEGGKGERETDGAGGNAGRYAGALALGVGEGEEGG